MTKRTCSAPGCERVHYGKGYCSLHFQRVRRGGGVQAEKPARRSYKQDRPKCCIEGCDRLANTLERCRKHYYELRRKQTPGYIATADHVARFWVKLAPLEDCWMWQGDFDGHGYGRHRVAGRGIAAHRYAYELLRAPIPEGLVIDHLCRRPKCVNPWHLEPVTFIENVRRGLAVGKRSHCRRGHAFTPENTYLAPRGSRECIACRKVRAKE